MAKAVFMSKTNLARSLIVGIPGPQLDDSTRDFLTELKPAAIILFGRNCENPQQLKQLTSELAELSPLTEPLIFIDHEGGRVQRYQWDDYNPPHASVFGELWREDPETALEAAMLNGQLLGWQVSQYGLTVNCAPVADLHIAGADDIIGHRAFSDDPQAVAALAGATMAGLLRGGVWPVLKHAPGHGRALADSHKALPVIDTPLEKLRATDFVPFAAHPQTPLVMTAHVVLPDITGEQPITLSKAGVEFLRNDLGLQGQLVADDLWMGALTGSLLSRAEQALEAGCDLLIVGSGRLDGAFDQERWSKLENLLALPLIEQAKLPPRGRSSMAEIQQAKSRLSQIQQCLLDAVS